MSAFAKKVALITDPTSGIGRAIANLIARGGGSVTLYGQSEVQLQIKKVQQKLVDETIDKFGRLDVLKAFLHYPHQQFCAVRVLTHVTKKTRRMLYWYPRLRYTNKYLDRKLQDQRHINLGFVELAKMGLEMISRDKGSAITFSKVTDDESLILSSQSPLQRKLIAQMDPSRSCFYVDGPFFLYVAENRIQYVTFTSDPGPNSERLLDKFLSHEEVEDIYAKKFYNGPFEEDERMENGTIHEQIDQTILALGVLEKVNENSASAWVNHLQKTNPSLKHSTVIIRVKNQDDGEGHWSAKTNEQAEKEEQRSS